MSADGLVAKAFNEALLQGFVAELSGGSCGGACVCSCGRALVRSLVAEIVAELSSGESGRDSGGAYRGGDMRREWRRLVAELSGGA